MPARKTEPIGLRNAVHMFGPHPLKHLLENLGQRAIARQGHQPADGQQPVLAHPQHCANDHRGRRQRPRVTQVGQRCKPLQHRRVGLCLQACGNGIVQRPPLAACAPALGQFGHGGARQHQRKCTGAHGGQHHPVRLCG